MVASMSNLTEEKRTLRHRLGVNLRTRHVAAGLTLKKASESVEMHWRHLQKIEAGELNATIDTLERLASLIGVDPAELLTDPRRHLS